MTMPIGNDRCQFGLASICRNLWIPTFRVLVCSNLAGNLFLEARSVSDRLIHVTDRMSGQRFRPKIVVIQINFNSILVPVELGEGPNVFGHYGSVTVTVVSPGLSVF